MDYLPHDPAILVSSINLYLRDCAANHRQLHVSWQ